MTYYNEPYYNEVDPSNHGPNTPRYNRAVTVSEIDNFHFRTYCQ